MDYAGVDQATKPELLYYRIPALRSKNRNSMTVLGAKVHQVILSNINSRTFQIFRNFPLLNIYKVTITNVKR